MLDIKNRKSMQKSSLKITLSIAIFLTVVLPSSKVEAHRSGCHRWHSCPSDSGSYVCGDLGYSSQCSPSTQFNEPIYSKELLYSQHMKIGNNAVQKQDYQTALINFKKALMIVPRNPSAINAIRNVESKIKQKKSTNVQVEQQLIERGDD